MLPVLDLRSVSKSAIAADLSPGMGLFEDGGHLWVGPWAWLTDLDSGGSAWRAPLTTVGCDDLGADPLARMGVAPRDALADRLGIDRALLPDSNLADILAHFVLGTLADPTGVNRVKPIRMGRRGLKLWLGSFGAVLAEPFSRNHPNFDATLAVRFADYRRNRAIPDQLAGAAKGAWMQGFRTRQERVEGVTLSEAEARSRWLVVMQKWTGHDARALFGRNFTSADLDRLLPPEFRDDGERSPTTTVGDTFVELVLDTNLESHTPTGANAGTSWALVLGAAGAVLVNAANDDARYQAGTPAAYRMENDLSTDDHYAKAKISGLNNSTDHNNRGTVATRFAAAATTYYDGGFNRALDLVDDYFITKTVTGTPTEIGTVANGADGAQNNICKLDTDASDLELFGVDGLTSKLAITNGDITGNLRTGIHGRQNGANRWLWDDFEAADLAVGADPEGSLVGGKLIRGGLLKHGVLVRS